MITRRQLIVGMGAYFATPMIFGCETSERLQPVSPAKLVEQFTVRRSDTRGIRNRGWLLAKHAFSFSDYRDPIYDRFGPMRVLNEDVIQAGKGFPMHPHRDMEIITYILDGALEHKDSLGNGGVIEPGEVQKMSAGTGIRHSEFNPYSDRPVHLLQIWIEPDKSNYEPGYQQRTIARSDTDGPVRLIASPDGKDGSVTIRQDAQIHACQLKAGETCQFDVLPGRKTWIQIARGIVSVSGDVLMAGDALHTSDAGALLLEAGKGTELLIFDFAA